MRGSDQTWLSAVLVLVTTVAAMIAAGVVMGAVEPTRAATSVVALAPSGAEGSSPDTVRLLRGGYADLIGSDEEIRTAASQLGLDVDALTDVDVVVPDDANTIEVTVTHTQSSVATAAADALAARLVDAAGRQPLLDAERIVAADDPARPTGVSPPVAIVIAGVFGGLLAFGALLALRAIDPPVRDLDLLRALGLPLLASVPSGEERRLDGPLMRAAIEPVAVAVSEADRVAWVGVGIRDLDGLAGHLAPESGSGAELITVTHPWRIAEQRTWAEADATVLVVGRAATRRQVERLRDLAATSRRRVLGVVAVGLAGQFRPSDESVSMTANRAADADRLHSEVG